MKLIETHLVTSDNQFGFKHHHGTDLCIFTVKSVIKYYNLCNRPVFTCFLDDSKADDRVNRWTLFKMLLKRSVSIIVVRTGTCPGGAKGPAPPPTLEIEKQKKKKSHQGKFSAILLIFCYILLLFSRKYHVLSYFLSWTPPPLKN